MLAGLMKLVGFLAAIVTVVIGGKQISKTLKKGAEADDDNFDW